MIQLNKMEYFVKKARRTNYNFFSTSLLINLIVYFIFNSSCKKNICNDPSNPECNNYDPCYNIIGANADFVIEESINGRYFIADTVTGVNLHRFRALHDADSFVWTIGAETLHTQSFVRRYFPNDRWLDVQLIVFKKRDPKCSKFQKESDTLTKWFYSWDETLGPYFQQVKPYPIHGNYIGYYEGNESEKVNVLIQDTLYKDVSGGIDGVFRFTGFPFPYTNTYNSHFFKFNYFLGSTSFYIFTYQKLYNPLNPKVVAAPRFSSYAYLDRYNRDKIYIETEYTDTLSKTILHNKFIGFRSK